MKGKNKENTMKRVTVANPKIRKKPKTVVIKLFGTKELVETVHRKGHIENNTIRRLKLTAIIDPSKKRRREALDALENCLCFGYKRVCAAWEEIATRGQYEDAAMGASVLLMTWAEEKGFGKIHLTSIHPQVRLLFGSYAKYGSDEQKETTQGNTCSPSFL